MALQRIETDAIEDDAVTTAKIAPNAVAAADIAAGAITNSEVAANAAIATSKVSGLGPAATLTAGTAANNVVQLDGSGNLPAVNGSGLTNLTSANLSGALPAIDGSNLTGVSTDTTILENNIAILAFKTQAANNLAKFNLIDQVVDEYEDATGIDASASTNENFLGGAGAKYYSGGTSGSPASTVKSHTGANQTFTVPTDVSIITFKAWGAGGGSGGAANGGGGGFVQEDISVTAGETLNVKVGGGGQRIVNGASRKGGGGGWTSIDRSGTFLAGAGGGGGAGDSNLTPGGAGGGTTGGDGGGQVSGGQGLGGTQSAGGAAGTGGTAGSAGTGGRALSGSAVDATGGYNGGGDGDGDNASWTAGGGGGGYYGGGGAGKGGGGGGSGYAPTGTNTSASGSTVANGSDSDYQSSTGNGGSPNNNGQHGAAVLNYTPSTVQDLTLQSIANTALAAPTTGDIVMLIENASGTATLNTDIKAWISRNGGSGWDQATLVDKGTWGTNKKIITANNVAFSNSASGTDMRYKITTHNQSAGSKETRVHATSLAWA